MVTLNLKLDCMEHYNTILKKIRAGERVGLEWRELHDERQKAGSREEADRLTREMGEIEKKLRILDGEVRKGFNDLTECECGPGQEMKGVTLKIPIEKSEIVESTLKKAGYDVGTDAYYADPNKFVSVIVRPTKELELRSGG